MDAHIELTESCGGDEACVARFDSAKEKILDEPPARAHVGGRCGAAAGWSRSPPPSRERRRSARCRGCTSRGSRASVRDADEEVGDPVVAPRRPHVRERGGAGSVGSVLLLNTLSCAGWMYNRGTPDVVRDDQGQIGEVRPMKLKPAIMAVEPHRVHVVRRQQRRDEDGGERAIDVEAADADAPMIISMPLHRRRLFIQCHDVFERGALGPPRV